MFADGYFGLAWCRVGRLAHEKSIQTGGRLVKVGVLVPVTSGGNSPEALIIWAADFKGSGAVVWWPQ